MNAPDLTTYRILHRTMRLDSARLAAATAGITEDQRIERVTHLSSWYAGFRVELHHHHYVEDDIFFPRLFERVPSLVGKVERIDAEHDELTSVLDRIVGDLAELGTASAPWSPAQERAVESTRRLHLLLENHLDFEDEEILPLFERHFTAAEYDVLDAQAKKGMSLKAAFFTVPWLMDSATPEEQTAMLDAAPGVLKLIWKLSRKGYERRSIAALGRPIIDPATIDTDRSLVAVAA